jgi:hypothetical protein
MFVAHDIVLDVCFATARPRLLDLIGGSGLTGASRAAYGDGLDTILRVVPFGDRPEAARLISVRFLAPSERDDGLTTALRWEAGDATDSLFPVLDADIALTAAGPGMTRLALAGIYRLPLGGPEAADRAVLRRVADVTVRALLEAVAGSITGPAAPVAPVAPVVPVAPVAPIAPGAPVAGPAPSWDGPVMFHPARDPGSP